MGLDEAGRGPVLGDLFMGGVVCTQKQISVLEEAEVDDSKTLSAKKRQALSKIIQQNSLDCLVKPIPVSIIDANVKKPGKKSLNDLEIDLMISLIVRLEPDIVYIDAMTSKPEKFARRIRSILETLKQGNKIDMVPEVVAENKGDQKYCIVGAASILAKVERDAAIEAEKANYLEFGDIGSGYPSDPKTKEFLRNYIIKERQPPTIARKSWSTTTKLMDEIVYQKKLLDFTNRS